ncbi:MAG: response regulator transcription factor [Thermoleophilaceae bacterium]|nr:response regulator transcription factor [Thermoleophilaceae bacterium]
MSRPLTVAGRLRCLVVDEHPVVRQGIRALLERDLPEVEVESVPTPEAALEGAPGSRPDVVIVDLRRAGGDVRETVGRLRERLRSPIVVFTADGGSRMLAEAIEAGAKGYVRKDSPPEDLVRAIRAAANDEFYVDPALSSSLVLDEGDHKLTARQREILQLLANGLHTEEVARKLRLSTETVRTHTKRILSKLGAGTRTQAVAIGIRSGLIE